MALLCRQQAVLNPEQSWKWLGQAERWEHLADASFTLKTNTARTRGTQPGRSRSTQMTRAEEFAAKAEQLGKLASTAADPAVARSLRQRARQWRELVNEVKVLE